MEYLSFVLPFLAIVIVRYFQFRLLSFLIGKLINRLKNLREKHKDKTQGDGSLC